MKIKRILLMVGLVSMAIGARAVKEYRDFTDTKGRTIRGCIVSYDAKREVVKFERDNRKIAKVPITIFSEADQTYIRDWTVLKNFMTEHLFKISANQKKNENKDEEIKSTYLEKDVDTIKYEIALENRSVYELKGVEVEYCIYYEQEERGKRKEVCNQGVYCGTISIVSLLPKSEKLVKTGEVSVYTEELSPNASYINGMDNVQRGDVHGIWIRVHLTLPSGEKRTREYCSPSSLNNSRTWISSSIRVGIN